MIQPQTCRAVALFLILVCPFAFRPACGDGFVLEARNIAGKKQKRFTRVIPVLSQRPTIDGKLDEAFWQRATVISKWTEYPTSVSVATDAELRLAADETHVYVGFNVRLQDAANIYFKKPKGGDEYGGSLLEMFFDTKGQGEEKFQFIANPLGLRYDSYNDSKDFSGKWKSAGDVRKDGWSLEVEIPATDFGKPGLRPGERWQGNFGYVAPGDTHLSWTGQWGSPGPGYGELVFRREKEAPAEPQGSPNFLPQPGFEDVNAKTKLPNGWHVSSRPATGVVHADPDTIRSGKHSLHFKYPDDAKSDAAGDFVIYTMPPPGYEPGKTYTYSCYVKTKDLGGRAYLALYQYPSPIPAEFQYTSKKTVTGTTDWTRLSITFKARPNIDRLQVLCGAYCQRGKLQGEVWFDDAKIEAGDAPTKFVDDWQSLFHLRKFSFWLDRNVYDLRDVTAVGLVRIDAQSMFQDEMSLQMRVKNEDNSNEIVSGKVTPLPGKNVDLTLDMKSIPAGKYELAVDLQRGGKTVATAKRSFVKAKRRLIAEGPSEGQIPLRVWAEPKAKGRAWPVSTGVPFAQDVLWSPDHVRLLSPDGKEVPCQTSVRSTWNRNGSIQWLGVDFVPTLGDREQQYVLQYGPKVKRSVTGELKCETSDDTITITTGPLKFIVSRRRFRLIDTAFLDSNGNGRFEADEQVVKPSDVASPYLIDQQGNRYEAAEDRDVEVVLEESGPVKAIIRATGWYVKRGSNGKRTSCELPTDRLCKFTIRLTAHAGQPLIHAAVSTVLTYDSNKVQLRDLALGISPQSAKDVKIGLGQAANLPDENRQVENLPRETQWNAERLKQNPYLVEHRWDSSFDDTDAKHSRATGWIEVAGAKAKMTVAVRNFWKLFPKEIEWNDGTLALHIWPAHARKRTFGLGEELQMHNIYKLWYAHQGQQLDFRFPQPYVMALDDELRRTNNGFSAYYKAMEYSNAQGMCIHNDFVFAFTPAEQVSNVPNNARQVSNLPYDGATLSHLADEQPHAHPDPAYACATGVFGPMLHADMENFGKLETTYRNGFKSLAERPLPNDEYGMFIHGGAHTYWYYHLQTPHAGVHRVWINGHYQIARLPFVQYLRSGDPIYLRWGRDHANNLRDIGMVHYTSDERAFKYHQLGAMYHCKGFAPWAGDAAVAAHNAIIDFLIYDYYLTGNLRSRDVVHEWIEGLKRTSPGGNGTREGITTMAEMVEAYRFSWDAELIELLDRYDRAIFGRVPLAKQHWWDYHPLLLMRYHGLTGNQRALQAYRDVLQQNRNAATRAGFVGPHLEGYLALLDGRPGELENWSPLLYQDSLSRVDQPGKYGNGHTNHQWMEFVYPCHKLPYLLKAMHEAKLKPERPTMTVPSPLPTLNQQSLVVVKESADREIAINVAFYNRPSGKVTVRTFRSDGAQSAKTEWTPANEQDKEFTLQIPADGRTDQYLIAIKYSGSYDASLWPLTDLKHEVAILPPGKNLVTTGPGGQRFYLSPGSNAPPQLTISSNNKRASGMELLDAKQNVLGQASDSRYVGDPQTLKLPGDAVGPLSAYFSNTTDVQLSAGQRLIVAPRPDALFKPKIVDEPKSAQ